VNIIVSGSNTARGMAKPTQEEINEWFKIFDADGSGKVGMFLV